MAQYYCVHDFRGLPVKTQAALVAGLPAGSRVKAKIRGEQELSVQNMLLAIIADKLAMLVWMQSEDGQRNTNRPESILAILTGKKAEDDVEAFDTPEEFERERARLLSGERGEL